jgi:PAS domain S-box-containing protein
LAQLNAPKKPADDQVRGRIEVSETTPHRMGLAIAGLDCGAFELDLVNKTFWCSPDFVRLIGRTLTPDEVFRRVWPIHHPDDAERLEAIFEDMVCNRPAEIKAETRVILPDGGSRWIEWRIRGLHDGDGRLMGSIGLAFDIDERKRQEAELAEARRVLQANADRLAVAIKAARAAVFDLDVENRTAWCSPEVEAMAGRPLAYDDIDRPAWSVCHPDDVARVNASIRMAEGRTLAPVQWRLVDAAGGVRWVESNGEVTFGADGRIKRVIGVLVDIDDNKRQETALLDSRRDAQANAERLQLAMMASRAGVFEIDFLTQTFWCSPEFDEVVGQKLGFEDVRAPVWPIIYPDDRPRVFDTLAAMDGVLMPSVQWRVQRPDGSLRWVESNGLIYRDADGLAQRITGTIVDIDDRKRQEAEVQESRRAAEEAAERVKLAMASARAGVFEIKVETRSFWCSSEFVQIVGRQLAYDEADGPAWAVCHPDDAARLEESVRASRGRELAALEWRLIRPDGEIRWVETTGRTYLDEHGRVNRIVGIIVDVDERKRQQLKLDEARTALQVNAERLKLALAAAQAGIFETDLRNGAFWCSPEFERIVGRRLSAEEAAGIWPMIHPDDQAQVQATIEECRRTRAAHTLLETRVVLPGGQVRWIDSHVLMHRDENGALAKMVGLVFDADERKRQELNLIEAERAASAAAEAKAQFLANMSHEIRTPMNGVLGILNLLSREALPDEALRLVAEAEGCGSMLSQLLNDVIDFSRIEAGRLTLAPEAVDTAGVLSSVAELMRPQAEAKGVDLQVHVEGDDAWVVIDPVRLRQVLFNLIGNAIKFTPAGSVRARLVVRDGEPGHKRLRFAVQDTGVGIPRAAQAKLFQRFQQADGSTAREFGGSGLGLVITRALAEMMGGYVGFTSVEGRGSTFWIDVPAEAASDRVASPVAPLPGLHGLRLLVVEDNATNRLVATKILEALGAEVETAEDGVVGVEAVRRAPFDIVLMDVQMPRMDGVEATRAIRALPGPERDIPIVGLTANVLLHQWQSYREAGMNGVAAKPISPHALLEEIARVISGDTAGPRVAAA